jgi:hypothetical protein
MSVSKDVSSWIASQSETGGSRARINRRSSMGAFFWMLTGHFCNSTTFFAVTRLSMTVPGRPRQAQAASLGDGSKKTKEFSFWFRTAT